MDDARDVAGLLLICAGALLCVVLMSWPLHEQALGTRVDCGPTALALTRNQGNDVDLAGELRTQCHLDAHHRTNLAAGLGVGLLLVGVVVSRPSYVRLTGQALIGVVALLWLVTSG